MVGIRQECEICKQPTITERYDETEPIEGRRSSCCNLWICDDCVCWEKTDASNVICKNCCDCKCKYEDENIFEDLDGENFFKWDDEGLKKAWKLYKYSTIAMGIILILAVLAFLIFG